MKYIFFYAINHADRTTPLFGRSEQERETEIRSVDDILRIERELAKIHGSDADLIVITNIIKLPI